MKKILSVMIALLMLCSLCLSMTGCGADDGKYVIGICQYMPHDALDQATQGFMDALQDILGEDNVTFKEKNASGEPANCATIVDGFIAENVDLIMANATPALQAAASATSTIPILGTSVTDYATALGIQNWTGTVGRNISGTSDLAPLDQQAAVIKELFPDAKTVGMIYCSSEPNSLYQINVIEGYLKDLGYTCQRFAFNDVNDLGTVSEAAALASDVLYVPTDNIAANYPETIANVIKPLNKPLVAGESSTCSACGVATLSISYYDLGYATGEMAAKILTGEADITTMPVQTLSEVQKLYNADMCEAVGVPIPEGYDPIG